MESIGTSGGVRAGVERIGQFFRQLKNGTNSSTRSRGLVAIIATTLAAFAISYLAHLDKTGAHAIGGLLSTLSTTGAACSLQDALVAIPFGVLIWRDPPPNSPCERGSKHVCLLALTVDFIIFASAAMGATHHLGTLFSDRPHAFLTLAFFAVLWSYLFYVLRATFRRIPARATALLCSPSKTHALHMKSSKQGLSLFLCSFVILLIMWLPYVISMAPGSVCSDMADQISQFVSGSYSAHHPLFAAFIYGIVFTAGDALAGFNSGVMAITLFQTVALALTLSFEVVTLFNMGFGKKAINTTIAFFALTPVFGAYCQWIVKDSLFGAFFALYTTLYIRCCLSASEEKATIRDFTLLLGAAVMANLLRHNSFYATAIGAIVFTLAFRKKLSPAKIALLISVIPLTIVLNQAALVSTGAQKGDIREALSIPFQQSARCASEHLNDATPEEIEAIDAVLDYSDLGERYNRNISDPVKNKAQTQDRATLIAYFKAWAAQGLRHPICYIDSFLDQTYGYWSLQNPELYNRQFAGIGHVENVGEILGTESILFFPRLASKASEIIAVIVDLPFFGLLSTSGFYALFGLALASLTLHHKKPRALILLVPSTVLLLTCMAGPLNGSIRYTFGNITAFPIIAGAVICMLFGHRNSSQ